MSHKNKRNKQPPFIHPINTASSITPHDGDVRIHGAVEIHPSPGLTDQRKAEHAEDKTQRDKDYRISRSTLIAAIVYAGLTLGLVLLSAMNNVIARNAMRQSQRPWIGPYKQAPLITGPIILDDKGIRVEYRMSAVNFGSYGANNVDFWAQLYVAQDISSIWKRSKYACENATSNPDMGRVLFPGQDTAMLNAWPALAMDVIPNKNADPPQKEYQKYLLACIGYRDQFGIPHHTGTIYRSVHPENGETILFQLSPNQRIPVEWRDWHSFLD
jgi:hypothetical protein